MTPERWEEVDKLFQAALALPPDGRETFLNEVCGDDTAMRSEVESLLAAADGAGSFLAAGAMNDAAKMIVAAGDSLKLAGKRLRHYQVLSLLGSGGMGQVYLAEDTNLKRQVALKLLPAELTANQDRLRRFEQEARAASALNHPNIITIHEIGQVDGLNFIVTEFIQGPTLREQMATVRMDLPAVLDVAVQVASALEAAHAAGIIHRDLKPENVMLRPDGLIKVLDFGLAKLSQRVERGQALDAEAATKFLVQTESGVVMGTVAYMSPEQARGKEVDARTDIFSLGAVIYEMLSGRAPFAGETAADIVGALLHKEPLTVSNAPAELQHIINKALCKDRDERYQTVKSLLVDLKTLKEELDFAAKLERSVSTDNDTPTKNKQTANAAIGSASRQALTTHPTSRAEYIVSSIKRRQGIFLAGLAILLLAAIGLSYRGYTRRTSNAAPIASIAVMPFVNDSGNSEVDYLSNGITQSLVTSLSQLPKLTVKAPSSGLSYKGKQVSPQQIANELSVQAILNGSLVQRGDDLMLHLWLIDASNGNQLWDQQYKRTDLIALQSEIARDVSEQLHLRLTPTEQQRLSKRGTESVEANRLYLRGHYHWVSWLGPDYGKSADYYRKAIAVDPTYALAYAGLADYYGFGMANGLLSPDENWPKCEEAVSKALTLDETLAEVYNPLAAVKFYYRRDWGAAERAFRRGIELNPNFAEIHLHFALILVRMGHEKEGLAEFQRAIDLDPLSVRFNASLGRILVSMHQYDRAIDQLHHALDLDPLELDLNSGFAHDWLGYAYEQKGMQKEAIEEWSKALTLSNQGEQASLLADAYRASGFDSAVRSLWRKKLEQLKDKAKRGEYVGPEHYATAYSRIGDKEQALEWIGRALQERNGFSTYLKDNATFDSLRDDQRFKLLLQSVVFKQ